MSANNATTYDIRINDRQRALLASALLTYIVEGGFQNTATESDIAEAEELQAIFGNQDGLLEQEGINDITPLD